MSYFCIQFKEGEKWLNHQIKSQIGFRNKIKNGKSYNKVTKEGDTKV